MMLFWSLIYSFLGVSFRLKMRENMTPRWITILSLLVISHLASAKVLLIGKNTFLSFDDAEATFTQTVESPGECGLLYAAEPLDACSDLTNKAENGSNFRSSYVLIIRGGCSFEEKVRNAEKAGYKAAIVYNNGYDELLVHRTSSGVHIHGVFVTRTAGEVLKGYVGRTELELWLIPCIKISSWSIMAIIVISLLAMFVVLVTCFFVHRHRMRRRRVLSLSHMPKDLIQRIPTEVFSGVVEVDSASVTCVICIDDYCPGDQLKILPCQHKFHAVCIDSWLGHWRSFCPVCKRDAKTWNNDPPASEKTPLLSPSLNSTTSLQSFPIAIRQDPFSRSTAPQLHTVTMCHTQDLVSSYSQRFRYRTSRVSASPILVGSSQR